MELKNTAIGLSDQEPERTVIELGLELLDVLGFPGNGVQHDLQLLVQLSVHLVTLAYLLLLVHHFSIQLPLQSQLRIITWAKMSKH